ncbi:hypothetical protein FVE85_8310 [Porphyridium purpureum]|uniref:Uncharacterized protein n=1 Tax=Porphyridium purpureum TaxID=35688 RepID=A0A5J4YKL9_PORPP|nr:hypothetical protein FVE85_8310 [Porphyridium purpureum]|eukprot:POR8856..scf244_11
MGICSQRSKLRMILVLLLLAASALGMMGAAAQDEIPCVVLCYQRDFKCFVGTEGDCSEYECSGLIPYFLDEKTQRPEFPAGSCWYDEMDVGVCKNPDCSERLCQSSMLLNDWVLNVMSTSVGDNASCANVCAQVPGNRPCNREATAALNSPEAIVDVFEQNFYPFTCNTLGGGAYPLEAPGGIGGGCTFIRDSEAYTCESVIPGAEPEVFLSVCCCGSNCPLSSFQAQSFGGDGSLYAWHANVQPAPERAVELQDRVSKFNT